MDKIKIILFVLLACIALFPIYWIRVNSDHWIAMLVGAIFFFYLGWVNYKRMKKKEKK
jgi:hypothetical protein